MRVFKSSGQPALDEAAVAEVQKSWTFYPGEQDGKPIAMRHTFAVTFKLTDSEPVAASGPPSIYSRCT